MQGRLISVEGANRMLPLLKVIVRDIKARWDQVLILRARLEEYESFLSGTEGEQKKQYEETIVEIKATLNDVIDKINSHIKEVEGLGCFVQEFKRGILNIPTICDGRKAFLCWTPEEEEVTHWHELDESFDNRQKLTPETGVLWKDPVEV